ncbi:MAG: GGGtGRT protein [Anaerovoracaceae bacterium]
MIEFENKEKKEKRILEFLQKNNISSIEEADEICRANNIDPRKTVKSIQPISFSDAGWAYTCGCAAAIRNEVTDASNIALVLGDALQAFCLEGSIADTREVGYGHGKLAAMVLREDVRCFAFLAGHESFAAAEGAIGIINSANKVRKTPLKVILNGLGKDAARIISRVKGFTYVETRYDYAAKTLEIVREEKFSDDERGNVRCYGADDVLEGVAIMEHEDVDISISGNGTNMVRFTHIVAGTYKKRCNDKGKNYFACASGGGIGRTLGPDETSAGPASYGLTDSMSLMYGDTIFAGSSSVPAHVEMMGYIGMGNNPMVGATVALAVEVQNINQRKMR